MTKKKRVLPRFNIGAKMLTGYLTITVLTIVIAFLTLSYLEKLNDINESIIQTDLPVLQALDGMQESLYSEELHGHRYRVLKSAQMLELFHDSGNEFVDALTQIEKPLREKEIKTAPLNDLHQDYRALFLRLFERNDLSPAEVKIFDDRIAETQARLIALLQDISDHVEEDQRDKTFATTQIGTKAFRVVAILCSICVILGIAASLFITRNISEAVSRLQHATREIADGNFDHLPDIKNNDELGDLAHSFTDMADRLKKLEEMYLDANPLTYLPGSVAIENVLKKRFAGGHSLAFCLVDLDHFKVYNDHYGYNRGNQVIKMTAGILEEMVKKFGNPDDFLGHIGGDDFVMITTAARFKKICDHIISQFDTMVIKMYDDSDVSRGYIKAKNRQGVEKKFPIMTISIAVVTNRGKRFEHHIQMAEVGGELKSFAKSQPGSLCVVDRRKRERPDS